MRHGRGHTHVPPFNPSYESRLAEEEATLRWLIARQPAVSNSPITSYSCSRPMGGMSK